MSDIMNEIPSAQAEQDDYTRDGLLFCGKCQTAKECMLAGWADKIFPIACDCVRKERDDENERIERSIAQDQLRIRTRESGIEKKFINSVWADIVVNKGNEEQLKEVRHYIDNFDKYAKDGQGLLLFGGVGTGKTMIASIIGNELLIKGKTVLFVSVIDLMNRGTGYEHQEENEHFNIRVKSCGLLIIDDLGAERSTSFAKERVMAVLNARYLANKPMIVTTNLSMQELCGSKDIENDRIIDRCIEVCYGVEFKGESYRKTIAKMNRSEFK